MANCLRYAGPDRRGDEYNSESSQNEYGDQDQAYHDDAQCPCYVCTNGIIDSKCNFSSDDTSTGVEFAVRSFWRLAKTQNDVESPMEGHCRGFHYKLLLHPRGTAGTDSEASHLSVFVEASVQDWYPQYWVFPNVRFELTVVNFKDPKQSVTSWAHWSFSSDATSRGWQKMISHSRLTKASGFMDDEGTVLVRGKADPPYPMLWSNSPLYHPQMMWEYIPNRAQRELSAEANADRQMNGKCKRLGSMQDNSQCHPTCTYESHAPMCRNANVDYMHGDPPYAITDRERERERQLYGGVDVQGPYNGNNNERMNPDFTGPNMSMEIPPHHDLQEPHPLPINNNSTLQGMQHNMNDDSDTFTEMNPEESLMHLQTDDAPEISNSTILRFLESVIPAIQPTLDADLLALMTHILYHLREFRKRILMWNPPVPHTTEGAKKGNGIIIALQKTFAYMELYPLAAACKAYKLAGIDPQQLSKYYLYELLPKLPNMKRGAYGSNEFNDSGNGNNANLDKNSPSKYESNLQGNRYNTKPQKSKSGPWNRMYMPIPFPSPADVPGYNADGEEFNHVDCCFFDGGRYEWETKKKDATKVGGPTDTQSNEPIPLHREPSMFCTTEGKPLNYKLLPGTLSYSIGNRGDVFDKILPPPPNIKMLLKAMHMSDLQVLETQDQLIALHTAFFSMLLRDLAAAKRNLKHKRLILNKDTSSIDESPKTSTEYNLPWYLRDQTDLEATCKSLFSGSSDNEGLFHDNGVNDIASIYIRCKHSHSLQKALENTAKTMSRFPQVLFFYLYPAKNAKKGELFDIPLRLDCTCLCDGNGTSEEPFDLTTDGSQQKVTTPGDNTCGSGVSSGPINYCDYSDEDDEEDDEEDDGEEDLGSEGFGNFDNDDKKGKHSAHIKWYSLYALILREGDVRSEANGSVGGNFHSLLLRPEEDGPWYRIFEGRVEKLSTKMEFTEWKCHRDFFCAAAIYIAEDYIDMLQVGEIDLGGNIKSWNPRLFYETLEQLGVTEGDISNSAFTSLSTRQSETVTERSMTSADDQMSIADNVSHVYNAIRTGTGEFETPEESKSKVFPAELQADVSQKPEDTEQSTKEELIRFSEKLAERGFNIDYGNFNLIYNRKVGQRHPRMGSCCEVHGYTPEFLSALNEKEISFRYAKPASQKEICRRINRAETIRPFMKWLFRASKENTALLNGIKPPADGKLLVKFLQQRERYFEEEFCHLISEVLLKEIGEHMALNSVYKWDIDKSCCGCACVNCKENCPALLLTENGRFPGEDLKVLLAEPSTILFRNIQILRCHLEYFCKDCRNLSLQMKDDHRAAEIHEFKATSERSALFLIECIWDACVRYTHDCRTILYLKAISDNPATTAAELGLNRVSTLIRPSGMPTAKQTGSLHSSMEQCRDLFVFDGALSQSGGLLDSEVIDYYDTKYDVTITEELRIMRHFSAKYQLPSVTKMRRYLRERRVLVYYYIRPHELVRAYLEAVHPESNIKGEIESLVSNIIWNEAAFDQKVSIESLSKDELEMYDVEMSSLDVDHSIGYELCDIYEELITKMLLHMQDAERTLGTRIYDYIYTSTDITRIVSAIEKECTKTIPSNIFAMQLATPEDACTCDVLPDDCRMSPVLPSGSYFPDFGFSRGPFSLDFVEISAKVPLVIGMKTTFMGALAKANEAKKKQKSKVRKQPVEDACVIPPLDQLLCDVTISQKTAHAAYPKLFPNLNDIIKYPNGPHSFQGNGALGKLKRWGEYNSLLYHQSLGYDFNVAGGFASMLKLENHDSKAVANPLLDSRKYNEADALRIKYAYEVGIVISHDLCGCEGFASEEKLVPTKRLLVFHEITEEASGKKVPVRVEHLYWGLRRLLHQQVPSDMDSTYMQSNKGKKTKGSVKCVCGGNCGDDEYECPTNMRWKPLPRDCFVLYALRPDNNNPIRRGRRRFTFMQPEFDLAHYVDTGKRQVNPKTPDVIILMVGAPISLCTTPTMPFPMLDDSDYPLLLFKWMCVDAVDLVCYGAIVCDAKRQLQHYIFEWLLPLVREMGVLPKLEPNEKEDIEKYQILEECSIRTVQNVRRWSCAIRKINKRTGDIIIAQEKRLGDSPASLKFKESVEFMHTVRELAELEALEFLPPPDNSEEVHDFTKTDIDPQESFEKVADDVQKLAKKKKKRTPRTAIPSNKKSTFSKSIVSVEAEPESKTPESTTMTAKDTEEEVSERTEELSHARTDELQKADEDDEEEEDVSEDEDNTLEEINIGNIVEEALETVTPNNIIDRSMVESYGVHTGGMQECLQRLELPSMLESDEDGALLAALFSYIQWVVEEESETESASELEPSADHIIITVGQRTRGCIDIMLAMLQFSQEDAIIIALKGLIDAAYERSPLLAASIACYTLCAMGNEALSEDMPDCTMEFVREIVDIMAKESSENCQSVFDDGSDKQVVSSLLMCMHMYSSVNSIIWDICNSKDNLVFLMNVVKDRLTPIEDDEYVEEEVSEVGFRRDALISPFDRFDTDRAMYSENLMATMNSDMSPFGEEERIIKFEKVALQELKIWWSQRETSLSVIKDRLDTGKIVFIVSSSERRLQERNRADGNDPLAISHSELKCLNRCIGRFIGDVDVAVNGDIIQISLRGSPNGWAAAPGDSKGVIKAVETFMQLTGGNNMSRSVANKGIIDGENVHSFSDLDDIRLCGRQSALVTMSVHESGALDMITTRDIDGLVQHYYARTVKSIPKPPKLPPQYPRVGNRT